MNLVFEDSEANCVLITPNSVAGVVSDPVLASVVGSPAINVIQAGIIALAEFDKVQVSYLQADPQRFNLSVTLKDLGTFPDLLIRVARAAFEFALRNQSPIAMGINFSRVGIVNGNAGQALLATLLRQQAVDRVAASERTLLGVGVRLFYEQQGWRVTLTVEPALAKRSQIVAQANFHVDNPQSDEIRDRIEEIPALHRAFVELVDKVLGEAVDDAVS